jgi:hypothetical protein
MSVARPGGPYNKTIDPVNVLPVGVDGAATTCGDEPCTYEWSLICTDQDEQNFQDDLAPQITYGNRDTATIDTTGVTASLECALSLTVTDASSRSDTADTTITLR